MRGEGHEVAGGVPRRSGDGPLSHGFAVPAPPEGKPRALRTVLAPRIYEGGGPRSGGGSPPAAAGKASSVTASPCQLPQRGSRGRFAPFLPPAFMRGEGHAVAGGVPRSGGGNALSHASRAGAVSKCELQGNSPLQKLDKAVKIQFLSDFHGFIVGLIFRATPHNLTRRLSQDFYPNSKFGKRRNTVCISRFSN